MRETVRWVEVSTKGWIEMANCVEGLLTDNFEDTRKQTSHGIKTHKMRETKSGKKTTIVTSAECQKPMKICISRGTKKNTERMKRPPMEYFY